MCVVISNDFGARYVLRASAKNYEMLSGLFSLTLHAGLSCEARNADTLVGLTVLCAYIVIGMPLYHSLNTNI